MRRRNCWRVAVVSLLSVVCSLALPIGGSSDSRLSTAPTNLKLVADDLHILARVTNAIFLQSAGFRKALKRNEVITEALDVGPKAFGKLLELDVESIIPALEKIYAKVQDVMTKETPTADYTEIDAAERYLRGGLGNFRKKSFKYDLASLKSWLVGNALNSTNVFVCDDKPVNDVARFITNSKAKMTPHDASKQFDGLKKDLPDIIKCVENVQSYSKTSAFKKLLEELVPFETTINFLTSKAYVPDFTKIGVQFTKLIQDFGRIKKHLGGFHNSKLSDKVDEVLEVHIAMEKEDAPAKVVTAGFESAQEMSRIMDDVRSKLFREQIALGKSTEKLAKALAPFGNFGTSMEKLGIVFEKVRNVSLSHNRAEKEFFENGKSALGSIESFSMTEAFVGNLKEKADVIAACFKTPVQRSFSNHSEVNTVSSRASATLQYLEALGELVDKMKSTEAIDEWVEQLKKLLQYLSAVEIDEVKIVGLIKNIDKTLAARADLIFGKLKALKEAQTNLKDYIGQLRDVVEKADSSQFDVTAEVKASQLDRFFECLHKTNYEEDVDLKALTDTIGDLEWIATNTNAFVLFFKNILTLQKDVREVRRVVEKVFEKRNPKADDGSADLVLQFKNNSRMLSQGLGAGVHVLFEMNSLLTRHKPMVMQSATLTQEARDLVAKSTDKHLQAIWKSDSTARETLQKMFAEIEQLDKFCGSVHGKNYLESKDVFEEATKVQGIQVSPQSLFEMYSSFATTAESEAADVFYHMSQMPNMDFASKKMTLTGAAAALSAVRGLYDEFFGNKPAAQKVVSVRDTSTSSILVVVICIGVFVLILVTCVVGYGFTKNGKKKYKNMYLFYFGKPEEFEKRWRYSMFLDRAEGVNSLAHATREMNLENVIKIVRKGAYINVYNKYGNTPLHTASRFANAALLTVLIKNGANRGLLNAQNKTAEQMLSKAECLNKDKIAESEAVFAKYRKKKFRVRLPEEFPISSYHIYIDEGTEDGVTGDFMIKFRAITSEEALVTTTHCIVKTEDGEVLATDSLNILALIFHGVIIVKDSWMSECLKDEKEIEHDYKYLVEKVKFKGVVYENAVVPWTQAKAKGTMPFLYGVFAVVVMEFCSNLELLSNLITTNGGTMLDSFPDKAQFNQGSHPYLHAHLGPLFVIHDGKTPGLMGLKTDPMFSLFTEDEFIVFMLKREINVDRATDPIHAIDE